MNFETLIDSLINKEGLTSESTGIFCHLVRQNGTELKCGYRPHQSFYPASVVKLFFAAFALAHVSQEQRSPELLRAMSDMLVESSNDATALVVDTITRTTGGPELEEPEFEEFMFRRECVNRWLVSLGYTDVNVIQKTWNEGPYGRERQAYGPKRERINQLTPAASVKLLKAITDQQLLPAAESERLLQWIARPNPQDGPCDDDQALDYIGQSIPPTVKLYSKAGWTSQVRHDVAALQFPSEDTLYLAIFTQGCSDRSHFIPALTREILNFLALSTNE